ncbi:unnamed protein product [Prunus armeniaca]|nr:unnamed protein product [Prunus armeniaca]CAB4308803.1 unnamed protein product [Prunus armeniaca]
MRLCRHSWDLLRRIAGSVQGPWIVGGDFNEILEAHEYFGRHFRPMSQMRAFREALEECGLTTIRFQGIFPEVATHHLNYMVSDHLPLLLYLRPSTWSRKHKRFLFEELWTTVEGCQDVISHAWESEMGTIVEKLKACQGSLRRWNKDHVGRIPTKLRSLQRKLDDTQRRSFSPVAEFQHREICKEMDVLLEREEMLWRQRSRVSWMKYGDKNTRFFHEHAKMRGRRNLIQTIVDDQGVWHTSTESIGSAFCDYFQGLFASNGLQEAGAATEVVKPLLTPSQNLRLNQVFSREEIETSLGKMFPTKSPGVDGMLALFYHKYWGVVGNDVVGFCLNVLNGGASVKEINHTLLTLIPKVENPVKVTEFRPISFVYGDLQDDF